MSSYIQHPRSATFTTGVGLENPVIRILLGFRSVK